jgi:hypothetical protein
MGNRRLRRLHPSMLQDGPPTLAGFACGGYLGLLSVDGLLHRIRVQSPSTPTFPDYFTDGWSPTHRAAIVTAVGREIGMRGTKSKRRSLAPPAPSLRRDPGEAREDSRGCEGGPCSFARTSQNSEKDVRFWFLHGRDEIWRRAPRSMHPPCRSKGARQKWGHAATAERDPRR